MILLNKNKIVLVGPQDPRWFGGGGFPDHPGNPGRQP